MSGFFRAVPFVFFVFYFLMTIEAQSSSPATAPCASRSNSSCDECLKNVMCLWCVSTQQCIEYPVRTILPPRSVCPLAEARWGLCWVNFQALIITMSVIAVVVIISILVCCFCCCKCERIGSKREDAKVERQANARKARQKERRKEMQLRHHEIRQKYGLAEETPYVRFEDD